MPRVLLLSLTALGILAACGSRNPPPEPGWERGGVPALSGSRVLVLPVQRSSPVGLEMDRELMFALRERGPQVEWLDAGELEGALAGAGRLGADPTSLSVGVFAVGEVRQVGDPLFGEIYRLAALVDARFVVLPVAVRLARHESEDAAEAGWVVVLDAALLNPRTGRVIWQGIVQGGAGEADSPARVASAADHLARRLLP